MDKNGYETDNDDDNFLMSGGNDLTMSGGNDLTMSGGGCSKPSDKDAYAGLEQLIDDPIIANELGSYKSLFDMFRVGEFEPPERLLGKYILETSTCTSIKKVMKKELTNKIVTHYNEKREDFEQYLKVKIQTYVDKNIPTELKKGYSDPVKQKINEAVNKKKSNEEIEFTSNSIADPIADPNRKGDVDQNIPELKKGYIDALVEEKGKSKEENGEGNHEALSIDEINPVFLPDGKENVSSVTIVPNHTPTHHPTADHIAHHDTDPNPIPGNPTIVDYGAIKGDVDKDKVNVLATPSEGVGLNINIEADIKLIEDNEKIINSLPRDFIQMNTHRYKLYIFNNKINDEIRSKIKNDYLTKIKNTEREIKERTQREAEEKKRKKRKEEERKRKRKKREEEKKKKKKKKKKKEKKKKK